MKIFVDLDLSEASTFSVRSLKTGTLSSANMVAIETGSRLSNKTSSDFEVFTTWRLRSVNICCTRVVLSQGKRSTKMVWWPVRDSSSPPQQCRRSGAARH